jgi:hypothetical protein
MAIPSGCEQLKQLISENVYFNKQKGYLILNRSFDDGNKYMFKLNNIQVPCLKRETIIQIFGQPLFQDSTQLCYRIMSDDSQDKINYDGKEKYKNYITLNFILKEEQFQNFEYRNVLYPTISVSH